MDSTAVQKVIRSLNGARVRYLLVGGLAVVAHGFVRMTSDVDLVIDLKEKNLLRALNAFRKMGYRPRAPVPMEQFADPESRARWIREKGMKVFSLFSDRFPMTEVDLFVKEPFEFSKAFSRRKRIDVLPGLKASVVSFDDLIFLKRKAGRTQDLEDIRVLRSIGKGR